jgi:DNA-directed RNA polymerase specialized sigma24 family protein
LLADHRQDSKGRIMSSVGSITVWIEALKAGDDQAVQRLWEGYFQKLVGLARQKLRGRPLAAADEEDAALSAFDSFCRGAAHHRFPQLCDRHDLWQILVLLTARKASHLLRNEHAQKRGGGAVRHVSALQDQAAVLETMGREPTPEFAAEVAEEFRRRLDALGDATLRAVALAKMEGCTNAEIAARLGVVERTVERRLGLIRRLWEEAPDQ